jgi:hypothetical protein
MNVSHYQFLEEFNIMTRTVESDFEIKVRILNMGQDHYAVVSMVKVAGVDEAGRGCAIGPLVVAGVVFEEDRRSDLKELGVKDSKKLSPRKREALVVEIEKIASGKSYFDLQPKAIDLVVNRGVKFRRLNYLEAMAMAKARRRQVPGSVRRIDPGEGQARSVDKGAEERTRRLRIGVLQRLEDDRFPRVVVRGQRRVSPLHQGLVEHGQEDTGTAS